MTKAEFDDGIMMLATEYEKKPSQMKKDLLYNQTLGCSYPDWMECVQRIIDDPQQRVFPHTGHVKKVLSDIASEQKGWGSEQERLRERTEIVRLMSTPEGANLRAKNLERLRKLGDAIFTGKSEIVKPVSAEIMADVKTDPPLGPPQSCLCDGGLVFYIMAGYDYIASCSACGRGSKNYLRVDPETYR